MRWVSATRVRTRKKKKNINKETCSEPNTDTKGKKTQSGCTEAQSKNRPLLRIDESNSHSRLIKLKIVSHEAGEPQSAVRETSEDIARRRCSQLARAITFRPLADGSRARARARSLGLARGFLAKSPSPLIQPRPTGHSSRTPEPHYRYYMPEENEKRRRRASAQRVRVSAVSLRMRACGTGAASSRAS